MIQIYFFNYDNIIIINKLYLQYIFQYSLNLEIYKYNYFFYEVAVHVMLNKYISIYNYIYRILSINKLQINISYNQII